MWPNAQADLVCFGRNNFGVENVAESVFGENRLGFENLLESFLGGNHVGIGGLVESFATDTDYGLETLQNHSFRKPLLFRDVNRTGRGRTSLFHFWRKSIWS